jgi:hypothetical protein
MIRLSPAALRAHAKIGEMMLEIETIELDGKCHEDRTKRLSHLAADLNARHRGGSRNDDPDSILRAAALAILIVALADVEP